MKVKKEILQKIHDDYTSHKCKEIQLVWSNGLRAGIANPEIIEKVMKLLIDEIKKQIDEAED